LQVLAIAVSISLIDLSSDESEALLLSPSRHSAATARNARVVPRYSPLALQNIDEGFYLWSRNNLVIVVDDEPLNFRGLEMVSEDASDPTT